MSGSTPQPALDVTSIHDLQSGVVASAPLVRPLRMVHQAPLGYKNPCTEVDPPVIFPPPVQDWIYDIQYLVLSGGGVKGYAYAGALTALDQAFFRRRKNLYQQLKGTAGSSIGALFALFVVLGLRNQQLLKEVMLTNIMELAQHMNIENLVTMYGLCLPTYFQKNVFALLERWTGLGNITFRDLYEMTQKTYVCCVTNINTNQAEYHSHETTPHYRVFESVAASMCIPLLFAPCIINGQCYVDGGMNDNCPFRVFPLQESLVLYLDGAKWSTDLSSFQQYLLFLACNLWQTLDRNNFRSLPTADRQRLLRIAVDNLSGLDFHITAEQKKQLLAKGTAAVEQFLHPGSRLGDVWKVVLRLLGHLLWQWTRPKPTLSETTAPH